MERLVTTSQAAQILGLSLQGVHYRIKKEQLKSIKKSGRTYVYISDEMERAASTNKVNVQAVQTPNTTNNSQTQKENEEHIQSIIEVKNEQILLLKDSMKWMKKQYKSEINRLEKNQKRIVKVFNSEIKLLQGAFNEMRTIYKNQPAQIQNIQASQTQQEQNIENKDLNLMTLQEFSVLMKKYNKTQKEIKIIIFKAIQDGDNRFIYNKRDKKLLILKSDFQDLV
ncbi:helix-turn-helix domain-containing protein [Arcobacter roscoffensis]|uniref:Helix-turn-helix domain-containing protein n=1 Tax=Arcobacter roscoffensis TaxID=2961520 RepID=A0ABY5E739_9BACT|nr:helix-turn-helix domain-containing protein [Arcobacter roscoffensis]UTJ06518.1 helix-turn-helix domain-containing protein [Arcobacter roscoffensis]